MNILGFQITRSKMQPPMTAVRPSNTFIGAIRESFPGAWQSHIELAPQPDILAFSAVFACVTLIASDIAKMPIRLMQQDDGGICRPAPKSSPYWQVLRRPNHYQTRIQFIESWIMSKLLDGNAYVLKERDARGIVTDLYVLDPRRVQVLSTPGAGFYYRLSRDDYSGVQGEIVIPATEIIHDRQHTLHDPMVGTSPIYACGLYATLGRKIQANSSNFFGNMSRPSGSLTAPGAITDETAERLKASWEQNFAGQNLGRLAVLGDGLKYEPMTIPAEAAQLIEQLKWTIEDVARCFHVPLFKLGGPAPVGTSVEAQQQVYLNDCLHGLIESLELCLDEGLSLPAGYHTELDLRCLLRMDTAARYEALGKLVASGVMSPNEARATEGLGPVPGGESPYLQQQNYSLAALAKRDALPDPFATTPQLKQNSMIIK